MKSKSTKIVQRTLIVALAGNLTSFLIKLFFGILANSISLIADAIHSIFDLLSSAFGIYGNRISSKPPDFRHPYGHRKFEYITSIGITLMLFLATFHILSEAINRALIEIVPHITSFSYLAVIASMLISITVSAYESAKAKSTSSQILSADSLHTLTDFFASVVVIAGFIGLRFGWMTADSIAAVLVCIFILYAGISLFKDSSSYLVDRGVDYETLKKIEDIVNNTRDVSCHKVRTRVIGNQIFVDMHVTVKSDLHVKRAHEITDELEKELKEKVKGIEDVVIHTEPENGVTGSSDE